MSSPQSPSGMRPGVISVALVLLVGVSSGLALAASHCPVDPAAEAAPGVDWSGCDLTGANLSGANLKDAVLAGANLTNADLSGANLKDAILTDVVLTDVVLTGANLSGAILTGALGVPLNSDQANWIGATCPDGFGPVPPGGTCEGHFFVIDNGTTTTMASTTTTCGASSTTVLPTTTTLGVSPTSEETLPVTGIEYQWGAYLGMILAGIGLVALLAVVMSERTDTDQQRNQGIQRSDPWDLKTD